MSSEFMEDDDGVFAEEFDSTLKDDLIDCACPCSVMTSSFLTMMT